MSTESNLNITQPLLPPSGENVVIDKISKCFHFFLLGISPQCKLCFDIISPAIMVGGLDIYYSLIPIEFMLGNECNTSPYIYHI